SQGSFHTLRHGGEVGLAIEGCKNGPAHEGGAAKAGEDDAAEPLHRNAAAIHQPGALAVDRQRRLVAEIDLLGLQTRTPRRVPFALLQARHPLRPRPRAVYRNTQGAKRDRDDGRRLEGTAHAAAFTVSQRPCPSSSGPIDGFAVRHGSRTPAQFPPKVTPPTGTDKRDGGMWPQYGVAGLCSSC